MPSQPPSSVHSSPRRSQSGSARPVRVGVLYGGESGEHEVSLESGQAVVAALRRAGYEVVPILIGKTGQWELQPICAPTGEHPTMDLGLERQTQGWSRGLLPVDEHMDVVFPVLHGTYGEDGTVQGLLDLAHVPYVGSGVLGASLGMHKVVQKRYWRGIGLPIVDFVGMRRDQWHARRQGILDEIEQALSYPVFVKPARLGSSVGVHKARGRGELEAGLDDAALYDSELIVERGLDVRELECAVLGNEQPRASVVGEIVPNAEFYSYRAKYVDAGSRTLIPAPIPPDTAEEVRRLAVEAFTSIDCRGLARVDFFLERGTGKLYLNEVNTLPGFTRISMYPKLWEASGMDFPTLVDRLVRLAVERFQETQSNKTTFEIASG